MQAETQHLLFTSGEQPAACFLRIPSAGNRSNALSTDPVSEVKSKLSCTDSPGKFPEPLGSGGTVLSPVLAPFRR